jgi:hypothetical protein
MTRTEIKNKAGLPYYDAFLWFIFERECIRLHKQWGDPWPMDGKQNPAKVVFHKHSQRTRQGHGLDQEELAHAECRRP